MSEILCYEYKDELDVILTSTLSQRAPSLAQNARDNIILLPPSLFALQSFPASRSFPMSRLYASGGQSIGVYEFRIGYANTKIVKVLLIR